MTTTKEFIKQFNAAKEFHSPIAEASKQFRAPASVLRSSVLKPATIKQAQIANRAMRGYSPAVQRLAEWSVKNQNLVKSVTSMVEPEQPPIFDLSSIPNLKVEQFKELRSIAEDSRKNSEASSLMMDAILEMAETNRQMSSMLEALTNAQEQSNTRNEEWHNEDSLLSKESLDISKASAKSSVTASRAAVATLIVTLIFWAFDHFNAISYLLQLLLKK